MLNKIKIGAIFKQNINVSLIVLNLHIIISKYAKKEGYRDV